MVSLSLIKTYIAQSTYAIHESEHLRCRCIDGRYRNVPFLPALAIPGGAEGEIIAFLATAEQYGFTVVSEKFLTVYKEYLHDFAHGHFGIHTDEHVDAHSHHTIPCEGCGHMHLVRTNPSEYGISEETLQVAEQLLKQAEHKGAEEIILHGKHTEQALLIINGEVGIYPKNVIHENGEHQEINVFEYHRSLARKRLNGMAQMLVSEGAIQLPDGLDAEYVTEVALETLEDHLFVTLQKLARGLPIFLVHCSSVDSCKVEDGGFL